MPIYEYEPTYFSENEKTQLKDCCFFEALQKVNETPLMNCPTCHQAVHRIFSTFSIGSDHSFSKVTGPIPNSPGKQNKNDGAITSAQRAVRLARSHLCGTGCGH